MFLWEIVTNAYGESYVRCYCQAASQERAKELFSKAHPGKTLVEARAVADFWSTEEVVTELSDSGFPEKYDIPLGFPTLAEQQQKMAAFVESMQEMKKAAENNPAIAEMYSNYVDQVEALANRSQERMSDFPVGAGRVRIS